MGQRISPGCKIIADISGETLNTARVTMGAAFGDALMAALASGRYNSFADFNTVIKPGRMIEPDMKNHELYKSYRRVFDQLYLDTKNLMHLL